MKKNNRKSYLAKISLFFSFAIYFSGCAQISALHTYNGEQKQESNKCIVSRTALPTKFNATIDEFNEFIQGDSHVETNGSYENEEAAYDCMTIGAKSVLVLDRGIVSSSTTYVPGKTTTYYNSSTNQFTSHTSSGHYVSSNTSAYIVVFFSKDLPNSGETITKEDYTSWKRRNVIFTCDGCK